MKKFTTIKEFINYAPKCLFCGSNNKPIILSNNLRLSKSLSKGILSHKVSGQPPYRTDKTTAPFSLSYYYSSKVENDKLVFSCTEKHFMDKNPPQTYEVMSIDINDSSVQIREKVEIGILNIFVRIDFKFVCLCSNLDCMGHIYGSTGIIAGAKSKKLMPFFIREECMLQKEAANDDEVIYTLRSDYYAQHTFLTKSSAPSDYVSPQFGLLSTHDIDSPTQLPLVDLSNIKTKESFQSRVESYVTFS